MSGTVTLPNLITVGRLILVPLVVLAIAEGRLDLAFWGFVVAGVSDAVDGWMARRFHLQSDLGAYLDPIADKALLVSVYVTLGITGHIAHWLAILVVSRDILIVGAFLLSWIMARPVPVKPLPISKANTFAQILLAATILGDHAFAADLASVVAIGIWLIAATTVASGAAYLTGWLRAMSAAPGPPGDETPTG